MNCDHMNINHLYSANSMVLIGRRLSPSTTKHYTYGNLK